MKINKEEYVEVRVKDLIHLEAMINHLEEMMIIDEHLIEDPKQKQLYSNLLGQVKNINLLRDSFHKGKRHVKINIES